VGDWARGGEAQRTEAAARHQGRTKRGWKKIGGSMWYSTASRNEHSKTEFGNKNFEKNFQESRLSS